ncbi:tRNA uridine-5-carboxymethylaminomethyl(34) synthesis GTPase MnmE [Parasulfitobacter algicola]|uniref:tRNA modification GTPase MnmE n=1 Tax=Parasulfitobacter algicola TaxID=2614809 RepID=A0ABX2IL37_9RHOB|nr:tRNA uridine-5-carboxymethylaminomethyl(34) synthesis GTPase MnmE [Sulfitobacter algicola]NSX53579.1 tRNA uridine-5-carboxymethylaminomethyl(34) synthesis GTPase MnmE [Sulfitobacter algicola]
MDTIFAVATARGKAGVSIVRISGQNAFNGVSQLIKGNFPKIRQSSLRQLFDLKGNIIDQVVILAFSEKASFTGEPTVELHLHGSIAVQHAVLDTLSNIEDFRIAEPGEFTRRALENEMLDISQVEGLADLIDAETEAQRKQALRVFSGDLGKKANEWRSALIRAAALLQVTIDFVDEDVPVDVTPEVLSLVKKVNAALESEIKGFSAAERIRTGFEVAIIGPPNIGKSTLLNALAKRDAAITSHIPGTTRDVVEVRMDLKGLPITIIDTAGLRETDDIVEGMGIERAKQRAFAADLRVFLIENLQDDLGIQKDDDDIVLIGKGDLTDQSDQSISGKTGKGLNRLIDTITDILEKRASFAGSAIRVRHQIAMQDAFKALLHVEDLVQKGAEFTDIAAEELRVATQSIASIIGLVDVEDVLDEVFSSFCLGK